ncbi:septum formation family protein [Nocardioides montaniterrae]
MRLRSTVACLTLLLAPLLTGCGSEDQGSNSDPDQVDSVAAPADGACRLLTVADARLHVNATRTVDCSAKHTAQTYAVGELPATFKSASYDDPELDSWAYRTCSSKFSTYVGADESLVLRTTISWVWFRPSKEAWDKGARWYRCDVVGGNDDSTTYRRLPTKAKGMLSGRPDDHWLACAAGAEFPSSAKVACSQPHDWRAVTTIKLGEPGDPYPGDAVAESRSNSFCSSSVKAWLNYPATYAWGYTFFHEAEWEMGNRRSVCWAHTHG